MWIVRGIGADPLRLLERLCRDDDFSDLYQPTKREPEREAAREPPPQTEIEPYDPADEEPDDDEVELGHLKFDQGSAK